VFKPHLVLFKTLNTHSNCLQGVFYWWLMLLTGRYKVKHVYIPFRLWANVAYAWYKVNIINNIIYALIRLWAMFSLGPLFIISLVRQLGFNVHTLTHHWSTCMFHLCSFLNLPLFEWKFLLFTLKAENLYWENSVDSQTLLKWSRILKCVSLDPCSLRFVFGWFYSWVLKSLKIMNWDCWCSAVVLHAV
jgi:hypothetical protein